MKTLIILNPHAGGGKAGQLWRQLEPLLWDILGELVVAVTQSPAEVAQHLNEAYAAGLTRVISIGGDGTNHALVNALAAFNAAHPDQTPMVYGMLPIGTGRDWARMLAIPFEVRAAAEWIANAQPHPTDIGLLTYSAAGQQHQEYFLNIASAGLSGDVDMRVNRVQKRRPWTFLKATVASILQYQPQPMQIRLDGDLWYDDKTFAVIIANGQYFGHGMQIAPQAQIDDGLFDVVLVKGLSRPAALMALRLVYSGKHLTHPAVRWQRARQVEITSPGSPLAIDLDGENTAGQRLDFRVQPGFLQLLTQPN